MSIPTPTLITGRREDHRATFSRFILPVACNRKPIKESSIDSERPFFRKAKATDWIHNALGGDDDVGGFARRRYFSLESSELLYQHAEWYVLEEKPNLEKTTFLGSTIDGRDSSFEVEFRSPALVLFEAKAQDETSQLLQIGFLIHEAFFPSPSKAPDWFDYLAFNEIFRMWRTPYREYNSHCEKLLTDLQRHWKNRLQMANSDSAQPKNPGPTYFHWHGLLDVPVKCETDKASKFVRFSYPSGKNPHNGSPNDTGEPYPEWCINPDNRAYTITFACVEGNQAHLASTRHLPNFVSSAAPGKPNETLWHTLLNVDRPRGPEHFSIANFNRDWLRERTYTRWVQGGTLYGFCEHAFAILCEPVRDKTGRLAAGDPPLAAHVAHHYNDTTLLLFYLRCAVFRLSSRLHRITREARSQKQKRSFGFSPEDGWKEAFKAVRFQFLHLENLYQYPTFSNQQQHLEMLVVQRQFLDVKELHDEIEKEIEKSDEFYENLINESRNQRAETLNYVGFVSLLIALPLGCIEAFGIQKKTLLPTPFGTYEVPATPTVATYLFHIYWVALLLWLFILLRRLWKNFTLQKWRAKKSFRSSK